MTRPLMVVILVAALSGCGADAVDPVTAEPDGAASATTRGAEMRSVPGRERRGNAPRGAGDHGAAVPADLERLATEFVSYALEELDTFPLDESITFSLGGQVAKAVDDVDAALSDRGVWRTCPAAWDFYGGADCPVDFLGPITSAAANRTRLVLTSRPGAVVCAPPRVGPLPEGRLVAIRPEPGWRTCASDFAVVLAADERGRLTGIDLTLAEP